MDDISVGEVEAEQAEIIDWFSMKRVPFNFHVITSTADGPWPDTCKEDSKSSDFCNRKSVQAVQRAYDAGHILGTSNDSFMQLGCHAHEHELWGNHIYGENTGADWQENDLGTSMQILRTAYPNASIRAFAAPGNAANNATVRACRRHGLDIVTTQATMSCNPERGVAPGWNYGMGPCGNVDQNWINPHFDCIPPADTYYTTDGIQKANGIYSLPCGSANSNFENVDTGLSVDATIGVGSCGCKNNVCPMIASAVENARKSNGLHWTVLITHPQTKFVNQSWTDWLEEFLQKITALEEYKVIFVTLEDMLQLKASIGVSTSATPSNTSEMLV